LTAFALVAVLVGVGCNLHDVEAPTPMGPSELAMSVTVTASPDILPEDGASQSVIGVFVRDETGNPVPNVQARLETNMGRLAAATVSTGSNGRASVTFTAPLTAFPGFDAGNVATISVTPIGSNFSNAVARQVTIRLVPPATISIPGAPVAAFSFGPPNPKPGDTVLFDASASFDPDGTIVSYDWDWGDGDVHGSGRNQDHDFAAAGMYFVTLTVVDDAGLRSSLTRAVTVVE
jgi:PKD repeat protein